MHTRLHSWARQGQAMQPPCTNGLLDSSCSADLLPCICWCRVSVSALHVPTVPLSIMLTCRYARGRRCPAQLERARACSPRGTRTLQDTPHHNKGHRRRAGQALQTTVCQCNGGGCMRAGQSATDSQQARTGDKGGAWLAPWMHRYIQPQHEEGRGMSRCTQPPHKRRGGAACTDTYSRSMRTRKARQLSPTNHSMPRQIGRVHAGGAVCN
jgi:hypothetical protein